MQSAGVDGAARWESSLNEMSTRPYSTPQVVIAVISSALAILSSMDDGLAGGVLMAMFFQLDNDCDGVINGERLWEG